MIQSKISKDIVLRSKTETDHESVHKIHDAAYYDVIVAQFGEWDQDIEDGFFAEIWEPPNLQIIEYTGKNVGFSEWKIRKLKYL